MNIEYVQTQGWKDYELIDSGDFYKLERFGDYILARPEPQAIWRKSLTDAEWEEMANAVFEKGKGDGERGEWVAQKGMPEQWRVRYDYKNMHMDMRLGRTSFKHVGIFPEQASNWCFIYDKISELRSTNEEVKVLNLFAYTGGASLSACSAGAKVTHVDSVKQVVNWSKENMLNSNLDDIRWIVEDARKFVAREVKRGNKYHGIILDPPAYGRGADGEKWVLENDIFELLEDCSKLLEEDGFVVFNLYSMGLSALLAEGLLRQVFGEKEITCGELYFEDRFKKRLPFGIYARF
ncbi:MAG: class I SAM-dependent methyltransferase [Bacteroidetes bacterium]|nr:class I SAM-dependent methyltransferase [Bacteroidota bacterium]